MEQGTLVRHNLTGKEGVVVSDPFGCCTSDETPVVFWGVTSFFGTQTDELEEIGKYEATPDMHKCGAGRGADCCIFLTMGPNGPCCERFGSMRCTLIFRTMAAKRDPATPFPECMIFESAPKRGIKRE